MTAWDLFTEFDERTRKGCPDVNHSEKFVRSELFSHDTTVKTSSMRGSSTSSTFAVLMLGKDPDLVVVPTPLLLIRPQ